MLPFFLASVRSSINFVKRQKMLVILYRDVIMNAVKKAESLSFIKIPKLEITCKQRRREIDNTPKIQAIANMSNTKAIR